MKISKERGGSFLFLSFGIYGLIFSTELPFGSWALPGPRVFPLGLSIILVISGGLWFIHGKAKEGASDVWINWSELVQKETTALKIMGTTAAFILIFEHLGYLLTSALYLFVLFFWVSRYTPWVAMGLAIGAGLGSWYFFEKILSVQFPRGPFQL